MGLANISMAEFEKVEVAKAIGYLPRGTIETVGKDDRVFAAFLGSTRKKSLVLFPLGIVTGNDGELKVNVPKGSPFVRKENNVVSFYYEDQTYIVHRVAEYSR